MAEEIFDFEDLTEEEINERFKVRTTNQRKSVASTYAYLIIKNNTDNEHHMTQAELLNKLAASPVNIKLDRKSVSRMVYTLADCGIGIKASPKDGVWYDGNIWYDAAEYCV